MVTSLRGDVAADDDGAVTPEGTPPPSSETEEQEKNGEGEPSKQHFETRPMVVSMEVDVPEKELEQTPSVKDGLNLETETDLRIWGCLVIQDTGILQKQNQVAMACAQMLFQRFYYRKSMVSFDVKATAIACLFLAAKVEECQKSLKSTIHTAHHVVQKMDSPAKEKETGFLDSHDYAILKNDVIKAERRVLKELGFCVHLKHPHKLIISYLQMLGLKTRKDLAQIAWNYMNDGLRTSVFVRFSSEVIACACLHLATLKLKVPMPNWWLAFDVNTPALEECCTTILALYTRKPRLFKEMNAELEKLQVAQTRPTPHAANIATSSRDPSPRTSLNNTPTVPDIKNHAPPAIAGTKRSSSPLVRITSLGSSASGSQNGSRDANGDRSRYKVKRDQNRDRRSDRDRNRDWARQRGRSRSRSPKNRDRSRDRDRDRDRSRDRDRHYSRDRR